MTATHRYVGGARSGARWSQNRALPETRPNRAPQRAPRLTSTFTERAPTAPHPRPMTAPSPLSREGASSWHPQHPTDRSHP